MPSTKTLQRIADYFGVSVDYLLGRNNNLTAKVDDTPLEDRKIDAYFRSSELSELFKVAKTANKENIKLITEVLKRMETDKSQ